MSAGVELTVAICTYRRADLLPATLASLAAAQRPALPWELLVVDNGCEAAAAAAVESLRPRFADVSLRYVAEPEVGIARARNRAVHSAAGAVLLFADDDVTFDPRWLVNMAAAIRTHNECAFWGGRIRPTFAAPLPRWFDVQRCPMLGDAIVRYDLGEVPRHWTPADPPFYTCNLALRVEAVRAAGLFDVTLGHMGRQRGSGEDSWMVKSIARAGGRGWYAADAVLDHPVPPERLRQSFARRFAWRQGRVGVEMLRRETPGGRVPRWLYRAAAGQALRGAAEYAGGLCTADAGRAFGGQCGAIFGFSKLWHALAGAGPAAAGEPPGALRASR